MKKLLTVFVILTILVSAVPAFADDDAAAIIGDTLIVRPLSFVTLVVGTGAFVVFFPFALLSGSVKNTATALVADPFNYTFTRSMGEFNRAESYSKP